MAFTANRVLDFTYQVEVGVILFCVAVFKK